jgi:sulfoxide reductase heme-binding subunit YedZ
MSTHTDSQKHSLPWFDLLVVTLGLGIISASGVIGVSALVALGRSLPLTSSKAYWFISRSSGVLAYMLLTLGVMWGLVQSGAILRPTIPPLLAFGLHSFLNWASLAMTALHALILLGDNYIKLTLADLVIPFTSPYRPLFVGLGVLAFYLMFLLALSFYARRQLGQKTFRTLHYASYLTYLLVTWHSLGAGSDSHLLWPLYVLSLGAISYLTMWRIANARRTTTIHRS